MATQNLLKLPKVVAATTYKRSTIYRLIQQGKFPPPIKLSPSGRASAWVESEINDWIQARIAESRNGGGGK